MQTNHAVRTVESGSAPLDVAQYHIDPRNIVHVTQVLRSMYSDPKLAVYREYICNAIDAHKQAGIQDRIEIHVPTYEEPFFSVRDFGGGLSVDDTKRLLCGYGSSGEHKRVSNEQIGGFGIGCKCAFSLCDAFTYTIWHGAKQRIWNCFLDEHDMGQATLQDERDSNETPGVLVQIPMACGYGGESAYLTLLDRIFGFMPREVFPVIVNNSDYKIFEAPAAQLQATMACELNGQRLKLPVGLLSKQNFPSHFNLPPDKPVIVLGGLAYTIDTDQINIPQSEDTDSTDCRNTQVGVMRNAVLYAPIGLVPVAPSREALQYSGFTKKVLGGVFAWLLSKDGIEALTKPLQTLPSIGARMQSAQMLGISLPEHDWHTTSTLTMPKDMFAKGSVITARHNQRYTSRPDGSYGYVSSWTVPAAYEEVYSITEPWGLDYAGTKNRHAFPLHGTGIIILGVNPTANPSREDLRGLALRALTCYAQDCKTLEDASIRVLVLQADPDLIRTIPWVADGTVPLYDADAIKSVTVDSRFNTSGVRQHGRRRSHSTVRQQYEQHSVKLVQLTAQRVCKPYSQGWRAVKKSDLGRGVRVYTPIDGFQVVSPWPNGIRCGLSVYKPLLGSMDRHPEAFRSLFPELSEGLLGVRVADVPSVKKNSRFELLWDYILRRFKEDIHSGLLRKDNFIAELWYAGLTCRNYTENSHHMLTNEHEAAARVWFQFASRVSEHKDTKNTTLGRRLAWWHEHICQDEVARTWAEFIVALWSACFSGYRDSEWWSALFKARRDGGSTPLLPWDLLDTPDGRFLATAPGAAAFRIDAGTRRVRLMADLDYVARKHPLLVRPLGLYILPGLLGRCAIGKDGEDPTHWEQLSDISLGRSMLDKPWLYQYIATMESIGGRGRKALS